MWDIVGWIGLGFAGVGIILGWLALTRGGWLARAQRLILSLGCLAVAGLCLGLRWALHSFEAFARSTPVAEVHCRWVGPKEFELSYVKLGPADRSQPRLFRLRGDQWSLSGGVVKWHPWLAAMGLPSYHRPSRISGRFSRIEEETAAPPTAYELEEGFDRVWQWWYRLDPVVPFVQAVYGSAAFTFVNPAMRYIVEVTPSGYFILQEPDRSLR